MDANRLASAEQSFSEKLLCNLFTHQVFSDDIPSYEDPELDYLRKRNGFGVLISFVARDQTRPQSFQTLSYQQDLVYSVFWGELHRLLPREYMFLPCRIENQLAAIICLRDTAPLDAEALDAVLRGIIAPNLREFNEQGIPLRAFWMYQSDYTFLHRGYSILKQTAVYCEYMEKPRAQFEWIKPPASHMHYGLWRIMENSTDRYLEAFLQNDLSQAYDCVEDIFRQVDSWILPSRDVFLGDIQYYFDLVLEKLSSQFGQDILHGIPSNYSLFFITKSISDARRIAQDLTATLLRNARKSTTTETFNRLLHIREFILENLRDYALSPSFIAERFNISPQLLSLQFKKCFGLTPLQYIEQKRVEIIKDYLGNTDMPIHEICEKMGIGAVSTLHRMFYKNCGVSPGAYRKKMRTEKEML